jgi:excisionase family DNA binding protein
MARDLTDHEVARELGMHPRSIQRRCQAGTLPGAYKAGRSWRIPRSALRGAQLERAFRPRDSESELRAATLRCREARAEMEEAQRSGAEAVRSDWRRLVRELAALHDALEGLPRDVRRLPSWLPGPGRP